MQRNVLIKQYFIDFLFFLLALRCQMWAFFDVESNSFLSMRYDNRASRVISKERFFPNCFYKHAILIPVSKTTNLSTSLVMSGYAIVQHFLYTVFRLFCTPIDWVKSCETEWQNLAFSPRPGARCQQALPEEGCCAAPLFFASLAPISLRAKNFLMPPITKHGSENLSY